MKKVRWTHDSQRIDSCEMVGYDWKLTKLIVFFIFHFSPLLIECWVLFDEVRGVVSHFVDWLPNKFSNHSMHTTFIRSAN